MDWEVWKEGEKKEEVMEGEVKEELKEEEEVKEEKDCTACFVYC